MLEFDASTDSNYLLTYASTGIVPYNFTLYNNQGVPQDHTTTNDISIDNDGTVHIINNYRAGKEFDTRINKKFFIERNGNYTVLIRVYDENGPITIDDNNKTRYVKNGNTANVSYSAYYGNCVMIYGSSFEVTDEVVKVVIILNTNTLSKEKIYTQFKTTMKTPMLTSPYVPTNGEAGMQVIVNDVLYIHNGSQFVAIP